MAVTGSIGPMSQPSFPGHLQQSSAAAGYTLGSTAGPLGNLPEEEFIEEDSQANAPSSFANFTFRQDSGKDLQNEPSLSPAPRFPPPANSSGTANTATDELRPPSYALGRRTSVSAESLMPTTLDFGLPGNSGPGSTPVDPSAPAEGSQITKTESQLQRIRESIRLNFLFRNLDEEQERDVLAAMREVSVQPGEVVIEQGATGDFFYVVESGEFDIYKKTGQADPARSPWGDKVFTTGAGGSFGELALMYKLVISTPGALWPFGRFI
jgi:cAMP-dependent protein kinase regulator